MRDFQIWGAGNILRLNKINMVNREDIERRAGKRLYVP
jgi:hypothetical protein